MLRHHQKPVAFFLTTLCFILFSVNVWSQPVSSTLDFAEYVPEIVDYRLANGLRVVLAQDQSAPVVAVNVTYQVGAADDPPNRSGFAHLFEHMMFAGSQHVKRGEYAAYLQAIGGSTNAFTFADHTKYHEILPANQLPLALWLESDRMASLKVTQKGFETQRQVVIQELNQRVLNAPYGRTNYLHRLVDPYLGYPPYQRPPIGSIEDLNAATLDEVIAFHDQYYVPNNATLAIVGDIDIKQTKTMVQAYFGNIPPGNPIVSAFERYPIPQQFPVTKVDPETTCKIGYEQLIVDPLIDRPQVLYTAVTPPKGQPDFYALSLLATILSSGQNSRFQQQLVRTGLIASASAANGPRRNASTLIVVGEPNASDSVQRAASLIQAQLSDVIRKGVTAAELARAQKQIKLSLITSFRQSVLATAESLQEAVRYFDDPKAIVQDVAQYDQVTLADIQRVAQTYLCDRPVNFTLTVKTGQAKLATNPGPLAKPIDVSHTPQQLRTSQLTGPQLATLPQGVISRTQPPQPLPAKAITLPPHHTFQLDNGLQGIIVEQHEIPKVQLSLYVGGSNVAAPKQQQGIADVLAAVLTKGTQNATATELAEKIESVGGSISADAGQEFIVVNADVPALDAKVGFDVLADVTTNPTFPPDDLKISQTQLLTALAASETDPNQLADREFKRIAYANHPYGFVTLPETVKRITQKDVMRFHQTYFKPNNALLVIVGDISVAEAQGMAEQGLGQWRRGEVPEFLKYPSLQGTAAEAIYLIDRPNSEQSTIYAGNLSLNARNQDRYPFEVVDSVLGSGFSGRLFKNLREDKGYTYGASTLLWDTANDVGTFYAYTDVGQQYTGDAVREILKEFQIIRTQPIPEQELTAAKGLLAGGFEVLIENPIIVGAKLSILQLTGRPLSELQTFTQRIQQVSAQDALKAAQTYIAAQPIVVVVGDATQVKSQLEQLGTVIMVHRQINTTQN